MFGKKRGGGFSAKTSVHTHMMRQLWPKGKATIMRDHMISVRENRSKEGLPKPPRPYRPKGGNGPR